MEPDGGDLEAPDASLVNRRWIPTQTVKWVEHADAIMVEHGEVRGANAYTQRHQARWRAQKLINLMVDLGLHERWELKEHTERKRDGWGWVVEYLGGRNG